MTRKFKLSIKYSIFITLLILFGIFKNSITPYIHKNVDLIGMLKPIVFIFMGLFGTVLGIVLRDIKKSRTQLKDILSESKHMFLETLFFVSIIPISSNPVIIFFLTLLWARFIYKIKINNVALVGIILFGLNFILKSNIYQNSREIFLSNNYGTMDMFFGMNVGGLFATNIFIIIIALIIFSFDKVYKKEVVFSAMLAFVGLSLAMSIFNGNYESILLNLYSCNILFIFVFILPDLNSSCYTRGGKVVSGLIAGVLTCILLPAINYAAPLVSVLVVSTIKKSIDKFFLNKSL